MNQHRFKNYLLAGTVICSAAFAAAPAYAQDQVQTAPVTTVSAEDVEDAEGESIVITGSLFRYTKDATPSPVTTVTAETMEQRGINTTQEAIQRLASNNGAALTNSFSANGAFARGASAVSLRGLSTSSTLVLFDGMRAAYYPLSDDGTRNFVDLNTIPDDIVDRLEVLRDGASSTYGADAIAGVVNVITRKEFSGLQGRVEAGISERGDSENYRAGMLVGTGDLDENGISAYASGFYYRQKGLYNRDRPYPFNSTDKSKLCFESVCGPNNSINGLNASGNYTGFSTGPGNAAFATTFFVAPYDVTNTTRQGRYQFLNTSAGCGYGQTAYTLTNAEFAANPTAPRTVCQEDLATNYGMISPEIERWGLSARATARITDAIEAYLQVNFLQTNVGTTGTPSTIRANASSGILYPRYTTASSSPFYGNTILTLPVYVCPRQTNGAPAALCNATNGTLNPNNPFAAQGQVARLLGRLPNFTQDQQSLNRSYRAAGGVTGTAFDDWNFSVEATAMKTDLTRVWNGYVHIQRLLNVISDGSYNFVNPLSNSQSVLDYVAPELRNIASSELAMGQASLAGALAEFPGGPLQLGVGAAIRYEAIDAPSANPDYSGPTERYLVGNAFGTKGNRTVYSAYAELDAPVLPQLDVNISGRYDKYSSGQTAISPKIGVKFTPIQQLVLRGTYSRGFRIPSFAEANALPTTGFVTNNASLFNDPYLAQYGCSVATFSACPSYIRAGIYGQTVLATPDLKPEKSRSFTGGLIFEPNRSLTFTFDYYNIKKTGAITGPSLSPAIQAYYTGQPIPSIYTVIPDGPDPNFPNAKPRIGYVQANFINANTIRSEGIDFSATARFRLNDNIRLSSSLDASYIINLDTSFPDGTLESYEGTLGNFNLTAGTGTPEWHGSWQNTLQWGPATVSATVEYFGGYNLSAADQGTQPGDCGLSAGFTPCNVSAYITTDLSGSYQLNDNFTVYVNVLNVFDRMPPIDPVTYGANNYNAVQGGTGIYGRSYRAGVRVKF